MEQGCTADGTSVQSSSRACFLPLSSGAVYNSMLSAGVPLLNQVTPLAGISDPGA